MKEGEIEHEVDVRLEIPHLGPAMVLQDVFAKSWEYPGR